MINNNNNCTQTHENLESMQSIMFNNIENLFSKDTSSINYHQNSQNIDDINDYYDLERMETPKMSIDVEQNEKTSKKNEKKNEIVKRTTFKFFTTTTKEETFKNEIIPKLQNIVSSAHLSCNINLKEIALIVDNSSYNPKKFTGLVLRIKEPKTTALIFSNGKMVCLGAKNEEDSYKACKIYAKIIKKCNYPVILQNFKIRNIVSSCNVNFQIPLSKLYIYMAKHLTKNYLIKYFPEIFPGLIFHYLEDKNKNDKNEEKPNIIFLIFASGNIVITGAKKNIQIYNSFKKIYQMLIDLKNSNNNT